MAYLGVVAAAYLVGSVPTGYLVGKACGIDIRSVGSGNIGATNVFRILGKPAGIFVLLVDALKGFLACTVVAGAVFQMVGAVPEAPSKELFAILGGVAAILGHNYTCWLKFQGGKGIATSAGVLIALLPGPFLIILATWLLIFAISRYVSLASITAAVALPFATWFVGNSGPMIGVAAGLGILAIYKHKANIQRLLSGTEHRFGSPR